MKPEMIIMLTNNDITVPDAEEIFEECKDLPAKKWGFKDVGLEKDRMIELAKKMKDAGKETYIEVVTYTEEGCLEGAKLAYECGFDYLTGTLPFDSVLEYAKAHNLKYYPFAGDVGGQPGRTERLHRVGDGLGKKSHRIRSSRCRPHCIPLCGRRPNRAYKSSC